MCLVGDKGRRRCKAVRTSRKKGEKTTSAFGCRAQGNDSWSIMDVKTLYDRERALPVSITFYHAYFSRGDPEGEGCVTRGYSGGGGRNFKNPLTKCPGVPKHPQKLKTHPKTP